MTAPDDPAAWALTYGRDPSPAADFFLRAEALLAADGESAQGWTLLARGSQIRGKTAFARQALEKALAGKEAGAGLRAYLARICCDLGDTAGAAAWLRGPGEGEGVAFAAGVVALGAGRARAALEAFEATRRDGVSAAGAWAAGYLAATLKLPRQAPGAPLLALLDYKSADLEVCSANLGDYIQTAAVMRQLARFPRLRLSGSDAAAAGLIEAMAARVDPGEVIAAPGALRIEVLDRDMPWPAAERFGGATLWMLCYGWHFHRAFHGRSPIPAPDNVEPIVFSFHLAGPQFLKPEVVEWLRRFAPIGCRDWTTVGWLLNQGVGAFFTGCVTTTWAPVAGRRQGVVAVDAEGPPAGAQVVTHHEEGLRTAPLAQTIARALERLDLYAGASQVVTSRLHCYLPCRAMGTPVELRGPAAADIRFDGLVGVSDAEFAHMAAKLSRLIGGAVTRIAAGGSVGEIRAWWGEATGEAVAEARARLGIARASGRRPGPPPATTGAPRAGMVELVMPADGLRRRHSLIALRSIVANTAAALRFRPLGGGESRAAAMEQAQGAERALYLAGPLVVLGDVAELAAHELGTSGIAARPHPDPRLATLGAIVERHAATLDADRARRFRVLAAASVDLAAPAFDPEVFVAAPATLRRLRAARACAAWTSEFGADDGLALNLFAGGAFAELPAAWNHQPYCGVVADPRLIHWSEPPYPWQTGRKVLLAERWRAFENPDGPWSVIDDVEVDLAPPYKHRDGFGWRAPLPERLEGGDWTLREGARVLGPAKTSVEDICQRGGGRCLIGAKAVWFSASDNSDPNANGQRYRLTAWSAAAGPVVGRGGVSGHAGAG